MRDSIGLVNAFAKDIALLPEWQQRLWVGFNVGPEAGVSEELLASQAKGAPADTQAPEKFLPKGIELLNDVALEKFGFRLLREHEHFEQVLSRTHRFRSLDKTGLLSLAKDVARLTADSIDASALQRVSRPSKRERWGSLKTLENVLALKVGSTRARSLIGPLVGAYELRQADAHLPGSDLLIPAEYSVVFGHSECLAGAGAARCAPTLYFANINKRRHKARAG